MAAAAASDKIIDVASISVQPDLPCRFGWN